MLHPLVREHGPRVVWVVGVRALGYPPAVFCDRGSELVALKEALTRY